MFRLQNNNNDYEDLIFEPLKKFRASSLSSSEDDCYYEDEDIVEDFVKPRRSSIGK